MLKVSLTVTSIFFTTWATGDGLMMRETSSQDVKGWTSLLWTVYVYNMHSYVDLNGFLTNDGQNWAL